MDPRNIVISDVGRVIELTRDSVKINGTVPAGKVFVDGYGVGDGPQLLHQLLRLLHVDEAPGDDIRPGDHRAVLPGHGHHHHIR